MNEVCCKFSFCGQLEKLFGCVALVSLRGAPGAPCVVERVLCAGGDCAPNLHRISQAAQQPSITRVGVRSQSVFTAAWPNRFRLSFGGNL